MLSVCVLFGGANSEHEVSLRSATMVLENLDPKKYNVHPVGITKDGRWLHFGGPLSLLIGGGWEKSPYVVPAILSPDRKKGGLLLKGEPRTACASGRLRRQLITGREPDGEDIVRIPIDVIYPVLHGKNGEDGTIQGLAELAGIPCVGCGVLASAVCMDKEASHVLLESAGIPKTKLIALRQSDLEDMEALEERLSANLGYPMFVKPANAGSSVGITKVKVSGMLKEALDTAFAHDTKVVVEKMMEGREIECAVMGNGAPTAAEVVAEIAPSNEFYDYKGKYLDDSTALHVPARIPQDLADQVRETAVKAYQVLGCSGLARVDFFVTDDGCITLNEVNTMPGFTSISMFPRLFEASGVSNSRLVECLIDFALDKK